MKILAKITTYNKKYEDYGVKFEDCGNAISINPHQTYQTHRGFGGAFTEASAYIYSLLSKEQKKEVCKALFSSQGLNYNLGRLTIGSCDFSLGEYDYIENQDLNTFSLKHEEKYLFPFLRDALVEHELSFIAASWSPLAYMKDNHDKCHGGHLLLEYYDDYAAYLVEYIKNMRKMSVNISAITMQNEPEATQIWESCVFNAKQEACLAKKVIKKLKEEKLDTKIFIWDHNRDVIKKRVESTIKYLSNEDYAGVAYHWYDNSAFEQLSEVHHMIPEKDLLFTEGCVELLLLRKDAEGKGSMQNAMRYAHNYILDCLNYSNGFIDWNLLLDSNGGPNHVGNFCEAPIMFDTKNKQLIYNYSYFAIKQFSQFITPNSKRIYVSKHENINIVAYHTPENKIVIIIVNEFADTNLTFKIENEYISCYSLKDSIVSIAVSR